MIRKRTIPLLALALLAFGATLGFAFTEVPEWKLDEIARPGWGDEGRWVERTEISALGKASPVSALAARYGGNWRFNRNSLTGTLHRVYGSGIDFAGSLPAERDAEQAARSFIDANQALFAASNADLRTARVQEAPGKWAVHFDQIVDGVRVVGGRVHAVFTKEGRIFAFGSDVYPGVAAALSTKPTLSEGDALAAAKLDIGFLEGGDEVEYRELVILPTREGEGEEIGLTYHLTYRFDLRVADPYGYWVTYIDAHSGEIVWRENWIRTVDFTGHSQGDVEYESYCDGYTADYPMEGMQVNISGVGSAYCDADGDFTLSYGGSDSKTITAEFLGQWVNVDRYTGTDASHTGTITPGTPYTIDWSGSNSIDSERDCFSMLNKEHSWLKGIDPTFGGMDYEVPCVVERTDGYCPGNAWYDYYAVNFCSQSANYGNTGRMADVIYHEYGHGITYELYNPNDPPGDVHEGNSDIASLFLTRESRLGLGFYLNQCETGIRNASNTLVYPDDLTGSGHTDGQMLSGFVWDSWQALQSAFSEDYSDSVMTYAWWYGRKLGLPQSMPDQVYWTFVGDDNDGNLDNGTPHHAYLCIGATNHGFDCPEIVGPVSIVHTPVSSQPSASSPTEITAEITSSAAAINESALRVYYRLDGGSFLNTGMSSAGGDEYTGEIPAQSAGAYVEYYIYAEDMNTNSVTDPASAPVGLYSFFVGEFVTVFEDDFEADLGWTAGVPDDDATTGMWERGDPEGTTYSGQLQPEDDHTPAPGVNCYATQLAAGTGGGSYDVDGGKTTLLSPVFDLADAIVAEVSYWRWYTNDQGASPGNDYWEVQVTGNGTDWIYLENTSLSANSWNQRSFNLGSYLTPFTSTVQFRFIASDEGDGSLVEAAVDDFLLRAMILSGPDPDLSTIAAKDSLTLAPDGSADSSLAITVTVRDGSGDPMAGIAAGDVVLYAATTPSGPTAAMTLCVSGGETATLYSTAPTNASGEAFFTLDEVGGCGTITFTAEVEGVAISGGDASLVRSPDFTGDGLVNFWDTFEYIPMLQATVGECGNLNWSEDGIVDFWDTFAYLPFLSSVAACP